MMKLSVTQNTYKNYSYGVHLYLLFCNFYGLHPYPTNKDILYKQLVRFCTFRLLCAKGTYSTLANDLASIQLQLSVHGVHSDIRNEFAPIKRIFKYAALHHPSKSQKSRGLTLHQFQNLMNLIQPVSIDSCVFRTILSFAFATGLRGTEFLANNNSKKPLRKDLALLLRRDRVFLWQDPNDPTKHFGVVWFFDSKTNKQWRQEFATIPCTCKVGFCAVLDLFNLIKQVKVIESHTVLFTWANGKFVTKSLFRALLKRACERIGLNSQGIGNHSTRKTCIQYALKCGLPDTILVQLGRWKSFHSIRPYINLSPLSLLEARQNPPRDNKVNQDRFKNMTNLRKN